MKLLLSTLCSLAVVYGGGCAGLKLPEPHWPSTADSAAVGTPAWWKKHKKTATFDLGKGYRVDGVEGYFDQDGRPINSRVEKIVDRSDSGGGGLLGDADFKKRVSGIKESVGLGPDQRQAEADFAEGEDLFRRENYSEAAKAYKRAMANWPQSQIAQDALFKQAESYFFAARYAKAEKAYEKLVREYPNTPHLDNVIARQFSIARYWEQHYNYDPHWVTTPNLFNKTLPLFDTIGRALKTYDNIRLNDPTGPLADDAIMASANSYFLRGRYIDADQQYDLLRKEYPRSDHQYEAHFLGLQCKLRKYQGPSYDGTPLEEAKLLVKQLKVQFNNRLDEKQRQEIAEIDAKLTRELATREFNMGKHFENIEWYGSAKVYYAQVLKDYPDTPLAEQARERLAALTDLPEVPTSSLDPLLDMLPENAERRAIAQVPLVDGGATRLASHTEDESAPAVEGGGGSGPTVRK